MPLLVPPATSEFGGWPPTGPVHLPNAPQCLGLIFHLREQTTHLPTRSTTDSYRRVSAAAGFQVHQWQGQTTVHNEPSPSETSTRHFSSDGLRSSDFIRARVHFSGLSVIESFFPSEIRSGCFFLNFMSLKQLLDVLGLCDAETLARTHNLSPTIRDRRLP